MTDTRSRILTTIGVIVASAGVLAGCSDQPGTPSPTGSTGEPPTETSPQGGNLPHSGAPRVGNPIADTSRWEAEPCDAITDQQFSSAGLTIRRFEPDMESEAGPGCQWAIEGGGSFSGTFPTKVNNEGLSRLYTNKEAGAFGVFTALSPIEGYPAVRAERNNEESEGVCAVATGIRDDLIYSVVVTFDSDSPEGKDPCGTAQKIAALAVQTMKGGA